jgi:spore germination protein
MKNLIFVLLCVTLIIGIVLSLQGEKAQPVSPLPNTTVTPVPSAVSSVGNEQLSLFVPYWSLVKGTEHEHTYDQLIYFGIAPTINGINKQDTGYLQLDTFVAGKPKGIKSLLTVRMLDTNTNFAILKDQEKQRSVVKEAVTVAKQNGFDGIMLDLEISALPFDSLIKQVNTLAHNFSQEAKLQHMSFSMALYGDTFYRIRPFEVKTLAGYTDHIMIMAYDFSKANGNPGPNFPLKGKETFGYDYVTLTDNFLNAVPAEKLTVILGLYGYDWTVDEKNISQQIGKARSLLEIQQQIIAKCDTLQCETHRDASSSETTIHYIDAEGDKHIVWFEDMESVKKKQAYLRSRGITSYSLWANSYF